MLRVHSGGGNSFLKSEYGLRPRAFLLGENMRAVVRREGENGVPEGVLSVSVSHEVGAKHGGCNEHLIKMALGQNFARLPTWFGHQPL